MNFEKIRIFIGQIKDYLKRKKEEREVFNMQATGRHMIKTNFMDHPYMQKTSQKIINDTARLGETRSVLNKIRENSGQIKTNS
jgi:hypothetical protein